MIELPERRPSCIEEPEDPDTVPVAEYMGYFSRLTCGHCQSVFEIDDDVSNGELIECEQCGAEVEVTGR